MFILTILLKPKENQGVYKDMLKQLKKTNLRYEINDKDLLKDKDCEEIVKMMENDSYIKN